MVSQRDLGIGIGGIFLMLTCMVIMGILLNALSKTREYDFLSKTTRYSIWGGVGGIMVFGVVVIVMLILFGLDIL